MRLPTSYRRGLYIMAALLGFISSNSAMAGIKCWTNSEGVRECGDRVPPEYAQQGYKEISEQGIVVDEKERALTDEEIAEIKRQREREQEQRRRQMEEERHDTILLQTFSNEEDIITARNDKIQAMDAQIKLAESRIAKLRDDLEKRLDQAAASERAGKQPSKELLEDIESLRRQIRTNEEFIAETRADQERIRAQYDADLQRFRELKGGG